MEINENNIEQDYVRQLSISIDSKIKRIERELKEILAPYIPDQSDSYQADFDNSPSLPIFTSEKLYNSRMFSIIEEHSQNIGRLNFIRSRMTPSNASAVNQLINSDEYLKWSKNRLREFFGH